MRQKVSDFMWLSVLKVKKLVNCMQNKMLRCINLNLQAVFVILLYELAINM